MRVLQVNQTYERYSGAEACMHDTISLLRKNHYIYLFAVGKENIKDENKLIVKESSNPLVNYYRKFFFSKKINQALKNYIKEVKPDVIHLHNHYKYSTSILEAFDGTIPVVQTIHDYGLMCPTSWAVTKNRLQVCSCVEGIEPKCLKNCIKPWHYILCYARNKKRIKLTREKITFLIAPSKRLKEYLEAFKLGSVVYLPHFINLDFWKPEKQKREEGLILYVGAITPNKGVEYLIEAMPEIQKEVKEARLRVIGGGSERKKLQKRAKELGINAEFTGKLRPEQVLEQYNKAQLLVMPSVWMEQFGMVGIEAMATGLPVVGSDIGGIPDWLIDGETGHLVRPKDSKDIAEKTAKILKDKKLWEEMSKKALKRAQRYNEEDFKADLENIYKEAIIQSRKKSNANKQRIAVVRVTIR
ncbi:MAG: glycosyltransferase family 4 protein [archaeon]